MAEDGLSDYDEDNAGWTGDAEYSPKSEFSKPEVVEEVVKRCSLLRAKEMKQGYFNTLFSKEGLPLKTWIEDSRKAYCSSVQALKSLIIPEIVGDKIYKKVDTKDLVKKYAYYELKKEKDKYVQSKVFYIPEIDANLLIRKIHLDNFEELISVKGYWNTKVNAYWDEMVTAHDLIFEELISVIHRLNYFKQSTNFG